MPSRTPYYDAQTKLHAKTAFGAIDDQSSFYSAINDCLRVVANFVMGKRSYHELDEALIELEEHFPSTKMRQLADAMRSVGRYDDDARVKAGHLAWHPLAAFVTRGNPEYSGNPSDSRYTG